jgi:hypothetical protein
LLFSFLPSSPCPLSSSFFINFGRPFTRWQAQQLMLTIKRCQIFYKWMGSSFHWKEKPYKTRC